MVATTVSANKEWTSPTRASGDIIRWRSPWPTPARCCGWSIAPATAHPAKARRNNSTRASRCAVRQDSGRSFSVGTPTSHKQLTWIAGTRWVTLHSSLAWMLPLRRLDYIDDQGPLAWTPLQRPPRYQVCTKPRRRRERVKQRIVDDRRYKDKRLEREEVVELTYRPLACKRAYRMIIVRKHIQERERGQFGSCRSASTSSTSPTTGRAHRQKLFSRQTTGATKRN